jgi:hypothetical protein
VGTGIRLPTRGEKIKAQKGKPATAGRRPSASTGCGTKSTVAKGRRPTASTACGRGPQGLGGEKADGEHPCRRGAAGGSARRRPSASIGCGTQGRAGGSGGRPPERQQRGPKRENGPEGPLSTVIQLSAGVPGLEPRLTGPEPVGLPITPYPNAATKSRSRQHTLAEISLGRERKRHWRLGRRPGGPANDRGRAGPSPRAAAASRGGR